MKRALQFHSNAVWPASWVMVAFAIACGLLDASVWLIATAARMAPEQVFVMREIATAWNVLFGTAAGFYAAYRLVQFHPVCNRGYREWLKLSPWTAAKPLPLGPVHLVWQDIAVVGALSAIAGWCARLNPLVPAGVFGLVYGGGMTLLLGTTRSPFCLLLCFLWPALMLPSVNGWPMVGLIVALLAVIWHGYQQSLKAFPWPTRGEKSIWQKDISIGGMSNVGWPYARLSPKFSSSPISIGASLLISLLIGWWYYCLIVYFEAPSTPEMIVLFAAMAAFFRLLGYSANLSPPFNLWGRLVTGRLIMPGFDKVFLTPLAVVFLAIVGAVIIRHSGSWYAVTESCVVASLCFGLFAGGPSYQKWILTGQHRYRTPPRTNANRQLFKSI